MQAKVLRFQALRGQETLDGVWLTDNSKTIAVADQLDVVVHRLLLPKEKYCIAWIILP